MIDFFTAHAREKYGLPEEWAAYRYECFPKLGDCLYYQITGKVAPLKRDGESHAWRKGDKTTVRECVLPVAEHKEWLKQWEIKTGLCAECGGEGKTMARWSVKEGTTYRPCNKCGATGKREGLLK